MIIAATENKEAHETNGAEKMINLSLCFIVAQALTD